jgi:SAM-dependent methyltransferase
MSTNNDIWQDGYKIPWNDPDFSRRMLVEHLTQDHDLASRRVEWIDRQVAWIHDRLLGGQPLDILDLGCGPGFYSHRLTARGHRCRGIDFGPASIEYADLHNPDRSRCEFILGDIRHVPFGANFDLIMILYGEMNVFSPIEATAIARAAYASLRSGGRLIVEMQTPEAVERVGRSGPLEQQKQRGLFSEHPHRFRIENQWLGDQQTAVQTFYVTDAASGKTRVYHSTTKAWPNSELSELLTAAGFRTATSCDEWPCNNDDLKLWMADKS